MLFHQHIKSIPRVNPRHWAFAITGIADGAVRHPLILSYDDLQAYPTVEVPGAIVCAGFDPTRTSDAPLIGEAVWRGVALSTLLDELEIAPDALHATLFAADGYTSNLSLEQIRRAVLVYQMDGLPLPAEHGFPARIMLPGAYGYKMPKWIERIELTRAELPPAGFWESRGYITDGVSELVAAILTPHSGDILSGTVALSGIAFNGRAAIEQLAIRIDDIGNIPVNFAQPDPNCLARWSFDWTPPGVGDYQISVVATSDEVMQAASILVHIR